MIAAFVASIWLIGGTDLMTIVTGNSRELDNKNLFRFVYWASLLFVVYTVVLSAMVDTGDPRHRIPADFCMVLNVALGLIALERLRPFTAGNIELRHGHRLAASM